MMTTAHYKFLDYVLTKQFWKSNFREGNPFDHVHIPKQEIQQRFFPFGKFKVNDELEYLISTGELEVIKKTIKNKEAHYYRILRKARVSPHLMLPRGKRHDDLERKIKKCLLDVSLPDNAPTTDFFNTFLQFRKQNLDIFFTVDEFSGRIHTPVSNFHRTHRPFILLQGEETSSLDVTTMQPLILGKILLNNLGANEYSGWINSGYDIYIMLQEKARLNTRDEAKKKFFEILFSRPNDGLAQMFGNSNWIEWINDYKKQPQKSNPHTIEKQHSNLAWLLQTIEVSIMRKVWGQLIISGIPFLSVHDEIIVRHSDKHEAETIFRQILSLEFDFYKLNSKGGQTEPTEHPPVGQKKHEPTQSASANIQNDLRQFFRSSNLPELTITDDETGEQFTVNAFLKRAFELIERHPESDIEQTAINHLLKLRSFIENNVF